MIRKLLVFINGYGVPVDAKHDSNYRRYLGSIARMVANFSNGPQGIFYEPIWVLAGGRTNPNLPEQSEADALLEGLRAIRPVIDDEQVIKIDNTLDSYDNLKELAGIARTIEPDRFIVFCEHTRRFNVSLLALRWLYPWEFRIIGIDFDSSKNRSLIRPLTKLPLNAAEIVFPPIHRLHFIYRRIKLFGFRDLL